MYSLVAVRSIHWRCTGSKLSTVVGTVARRAYGSPSTLGNGGSVGSSAQNACRGHPDRRPFFERPTTAPFHYSRRWSMVRS
jgi:hypothetical protein